MSVRIITGDALAVLRVSALEIDDTIRWWRAHGICPPIDHQMADSGSPERNNASWRIVRGGADPVGCRCPWPLTFFAD